jgi:glutathione synthase/RimK-type ligase-like ATP-grasp enzyme
MADEKIVGILVGRENTFPQAFIDRVNSKNMGVTATFCQLGGTRMDEPVPYSVIVDRISHEIPYYRAYLKKAVLDGCVVINNPFWWCADDKFFECCLAVKQGVAVPRTVVLPQKSYVEGVTSESLRNLEYPLDWKALTDYTGFPAFMKPFVGGGWKNVYKVHSIDELIWCFDQTGELGMILQEGIDFDKYARCICLGQQNIQVIHYEPGNPFHMRYVVDDAEQFFGKDLHARIVQDARTLTSTLGYDMDTCEFAVRDGIPYAIDWLNPAPDMDYYSVTPSYFEWAVENMANLVIDRALHGYAPGAGYRWDRWLNSTPAPVSNPLKDWTEFAHEDVRGAVEEKRPKKAASKPAKSDGEGGEPHGSGVPEADTGMAGGGPSIPHPVPDAETTP